MLYLQYLLRYLSFYELKSTALEFSYRGSNTSGGKYSLKLPDTPRRLCWVAVLLENTNRLSLELLVIGRFT